jgi:hypothetical protein
MKRILASSAIISLAFVWATAPSTWLRTAAAYEEGGCCSEGGGDQGGGNQGNGGGEQGGASQGDSGGSTTGGGRRGRDSRRVINVALFTANILYPEVLYPNSDRDPDELTETEQAFLCSMSRVRTSDRAALMRWFPGFLAEIMQRPLEMVREGLRSESCESKTR